MKSLIVIYIPLKIGMSDTYVKTIEKSIQKDFDKLKDKEITKDFHILTIFDPYRNKIEVKVFFNPRQL
jgi:hypothetical protein